MIDELLKEIKELQEAKMLLEKIYIEASPCKHSYIEEDTWAKVCDYFDFDDGE